MKRLIVSLLLLLMSLGAWAQFAGELHRSGTRLKLDGEKLSREAQAVFLSEIGCLDSWNKAKSGRNTGIGLTVGGGTAAVGGSLLFLVGATASMLGAVVGGAVGSIGGEESAQQGAENGAKAGEPYMTAGLITAGAGIAAVGVGIPLMAVNGKKLSRIVDAYNAGNGDGPTAQLSLGPAPYGFGLTIRF